MLSDESPENSKWMIASREEFLIFLFILPAKRTARDVWIKESSSMESIDIIIFSSKNVIGLISK